MSAARMYELYVVVDLLDVDIWHMISVVNFPSDEKILVFNWPDAILSPVVLRLISPMGYFQFIISNLKVHQ